jgi:hypothetical protein
MNRAERRSSEHGKGQEAKMIRALDEHASAWLIKRMKEPSALTKTAQELVEEYWQSVKDKQE